MGSPLEDYAQKCYDDAQYEKHRYKPFYKCECCGENFVPYDQPGGMQVAGEKEFYCPECVKFSNHIAYIRNYASSIDEAIFIIEDLRYIF